MLGSESVLGSGSQFRTRTEPGTGTQNPEPRTVGHAYRCSSRIRVGRHRRRRARLCADADRRGTPRRARTSVRSAPCRAAPCGDLRRGEVSRRKPRLFAERARRSRRAAFGACGRRARTRPAAAAGVRRISRFACAHVRHYPPRQRPVPHAEGARRELRIVQEPDRRRAQQNRPVGRGERQRQPRAGAGAHADAQAADALAIDARIVSSRQGHVPLSPGSGRERSRRAIRARRQGRASRVDSRHHSRQLGQRRQPLSRAAQHGRDQQRNRGARAAGARRGASHPAAAHRFVPTETHRAASGRRSGSRAGRDPGQGTLRAARFGCRAGALDRRPARAAGRSPPAADPGGRRAAAGRR